MAEDTLTSDSFVGAAVIRQIVILVGLAISVALGVAMVLWMQEPEYGLLYPTLEGQDAAQVTESLSQMNIPFQIHPNSGAILVPRHDVQRVKLRLAAQGLPQSRGQGYEMLNKASEFGTSQFMELARYRLALENELARTIASMQSIKSARVHLAIPKEPVFIRDRRKSSASVFIDLYPGRRIDKFQVTAIINMVASSIPEMKPEDVTVVDQKGSLLTDTDGNDAFAITGRQLDIKKRIEQNYIQRIKQLLAPILGIDRFRTQVSADVDFTNRVESAETFSPERAAVRSSQVVAVDVNQAGAIAAGIPGALTNVPPTQPGNADAEGNAQNNAAQQDPSKQIRSVQNFELDKTISHTKQQPWKVERLSVAVAIDDMLVPDEAGALTKQPVSEEQLARLTQLVRNAIGYSQTRGDVVEVTNVAFAKPEAISELPAIPFYEQPWFLAVIKYIIGFAGLLILIFAVLRPILQSLFSTDPSPEMSMAVRDDIDDDLDGDEGSLVHKQPAPSLPQPSATYGARMETVKSMVRDQPGRVAEVVMEWVGDEE